MALIYQKRNLENIEKLADNTKAKAKAWHDFLEKNEIEILIYETIRTEAQQRENVAKGASQTMKSYHLVGQALDFVPVDSKGKTLWSGYGSAKVKKAIAEAKRLGFEWGGDWTSFVDKPHLQYNHKGYGTDTFTGKTVSTSVPKPVSKPTSTSTLLKEGSKGASVKTLQADLNKLGYGLAVDGIFGAGTEKAVRDFQDVKRISVDGIAGKNTLAELKTALTMKTASKPLLVFGSRGSSVKELQTMLNRVLDLKLATDGIFGNGTDLAVRKFQSKYRLGVDGKAGKNTWDRLQRLYK